MQTLKMDYNPNTITADIAKLTEQMTDGGKEALLEAANLILGLAQLNVRVDKGNLRDSGRIERKGDMVSVVFGNAKVNYAGVIEARYPYLAPAVNVVMPQITGIIEKRVVERVSRGP